MKICIYKVFLNIKWAYSSSTSTGSSNGCFSPWSWCWFVFCAIPMRPSVLLVSSWSSALWWAAFIGVRWCCCSKYCFSFWRHSVVASCPCASSLACYIWILATTFDAFLFAIWNYNWMPFLAVFVQLCSHFTSSIGQNLLSWFHSISWWSLILQNVGINWSRLIAMLGCFSFRTYFATRLFIWSVS